MRLIGEMADLHPRDGECFTMYDGGLIAVMCCLVCQSSPRLTRPFLKKRKDSDGTMPRVSWPAST